MMLNTVILLIYRQLSILHMFLLIFKSINILKSKGSVLRYVFVKTVGYGFRGVRLDISALCLDCDVLAGKKPCGISVLRPSRVWSSCTNVNLKPYPALFGECAIKLTEQRPPQGRRGGGSMSLV